MPKFEYEKIPDLYRDFYGRNDVDSDSIKIQSLENIKKGYSRYIKRNFQKEIGFPTLNDQSKLKLLDFGSGDCLDLSELDTLNFDVWGYDTDPNSQKIAVDLGYKIIPNSYALKDFVNFFDYIQLNQVIEHFINPESDLNEITSLLKIDGVLHIETPNVESIYRKILKKKWINWHVPYHQHHFSIESIENILHKSGYEIFNIETNTPYQWTLTQINVLLHHFFPVRFFSTWSNKATKTSKKRREFIKYGIILKLLKFFVDLFNYIIDKSRYGDSIVISARRIR
jgi:2-polyprenyl-3-methyl-5-hydroxy-6-metoxy-1,4-benzoquinol methylase